MKTTWRAGSVALITAGAVLLSTPYLAVADGRSESAESEEEKAVTELLDAAAELVKNPIREAETAEAALTAAKMQDRRVEVLQMRTETDTVYANADGTLTRTSAAGPVRMVKDGRWVDVDLDFKHTADGDVVAAAHPEGLRLAGAGGTKARSLKAAAAAPQDTARDLVVLGKGDQKIAMQWKGGLPAPQLSDNTATYPEAVPGGDLVVEATRTGFEQYLKLRKAPQDGAPLVLPLVLPEGMRAKAAADGGIDFRDASGETVATMPAPTMWDSQVDPRSLEHTNRRKVAMEVTQSGNTAQLSLRPDTAWLRDEHTQYPVVIDPSTDALDVLFDTFVQGGDTTDQSVNTDLKVGWPGDYEGSTKRVARSFLTFRTSNFADALVSKASLKMWNYHSWSCEKRDWEVWAAGTADKNTRWTKQPARLEKIATSSDTKSAACKTEGWATADITRLAQTWSSAKAETGSVALNAANESDTYGWKRFYSADAADQTKVPTLEVTYNYRPRNGANLQAGAPFISNGGIFKVNTTTPILRFSTEDTNGDDEIIGTYEITDIATGKVVATVNAPAAASNATSQLKVPAGKLASGKTYSFRTTTFDGEHYANGWSDPVRFTVDTSWKPTAAENTLGLANTYSDAADITAATSSDSTYASIAVTEDNVVSVPWDGKNKSIDIKNGIMPNQLSIPEAGSQGTQVGGNVVYTSTGPVDTVVQPTADGGSRTLNILKNSTAPKVYETNFQIPAGMYAVTHDDGSVSLYSTGDDNADKAPAKEAAAFFDAPWAKDAQGMDVPTSYKVVGNKIVQSVEFSSASAFPIVIDPGFWSTTWKITKCAAAIAGVVFSLTPMGSSTRIWTAVRLVKRIGVKKTANLIRTYAKHRKMTSAHRKAVTALLGITAIKNACKF
ncbi:DNRLRE domain-containing protein [Streptomyces sp. NBC_01237]|uniref:DNRLRE domain-containing protein n=1 Tax=Streptomyces sp. NBC_01237 TaxID=2903790 RepID=UPI002DDB635B|nr:DNRLRE domain-containing protein [Streptomyces sp. NBC_01237]WRZ70429.1 DNRLRE domain-containing protein [Streptomyces sp. NBC_01237]